MVMISGNTIRLLLVLIISTCMASFSDIKSLQNSPNDSIMPDRTVKGYFDFVTEHLNNATEAGQFEPSQE